ncbi:hypothetical protein GYMLUDRAFT_49114 [Collybiopsis luxurians FD-317 M1]|uniref:Uncharacterized protein n=1 Tax=Collybiopsis luxurians FD-317 M1 TaxID=944289 RepID=A0A0D0C7N8_9AGAR|nr:hypothetical protein GYMLUDRAFT_49114 [Collybiopsis luxurians FD-317 M1]
MIIPSITHLHALVVRSATTDVEAGSASSSTSDSCNDINDCRTLLQIVWSCISVLITCTWVSVHPNVPGPDDSSWKVLRRKIGLMIIALIAPEMLVLWAARQWFAARKLSERYPGWTRTHAFFALMGGFALYEGKKCISVLRFIPDNYSSAKVPIWAHFENLERRTVINDNTPSIHSDSTLVPLTGHASMPSSDDLKQPPAADNEVESEGCPSAPSHTDVEHDNPVSSHDNDDTLVISADSNPKSGTQTERGELKVPLLASSDFEGRYNQTHTTPTLYTVGKFAECYATRFDRRSFAAHLNLIARIPEAEIKDRSHSDGFSKLIAVMQTTWFVVQLLARWIEGLPVTELEVMTLAFAAMNVLIYFFWWDKPQGVGCPVRIVPKSVDEDVVDPLAGASAQKDGWVAIAWSWLRNILGSIFEMVRGFSRQTFKGMLLDVLSIPSITIEFLMDFVNTIASVILEDNASIGEFKMVSSFERTTKLEPKNAQDKFIAYGAAVMFGAIHCAAWTSKFPSPAEEVLWKVCSLLVTCAPMYLALCNIIWNIYLNMPDWVEGCLVLVYIGTIFFYILARLSLIVQPFVALRDLPSGIFIAVQWTNFIPHI